MSHQPSSTVRVAVTQFEPAWLDLPKAVEKTCRLIREAAENGAKLVSFPECWIPGYPAWIWSRPIDFELSTAYMKNSLHADSNEMRRICQSAADHHIAVVLGFGENFKGSLYISQAIINAEGSIEVLRRKLKATHMERTIFGDASGSTLQNVVELPDVGRVGTLACWEHTQPLLKYHTYHQRETIHVAAWPPLYEHDGGPGLYSMSKEASGVTMNTPGGGSSAIFGPDGRLVADGLPETEEGFIYAELQLDDILKAKGFLDVCGHYSRPDLLWLGVDKKEKTHVV
ncbi:hypothetical protein J4E85_004030 [Alternaria conjuncta]|uniref:uncharacterized protein n=1 Tax=Alternaria conjuncta TaxID=181017 RepID=UPI002220EE0A|nr:uncharacterized protein J4E85_004030 [Alternaria conjuncta]KAI4931437.1 hypothetical protein J4E85_004030 [Alternaria conjuncta]